jgi:hypothetical protein
VYICALIHTKKEKTMTTTIKVQNAEGGHFENGWAETQFEPTENFLSENGLTGGENTIWEKGDQYAVGTVNTWGKQEGCAAVFHKSHLG